MSMYYADPDENRMEFQVETFTAQDDAGLTPDARARISGSIGVEFDPDLWLEKLKAVTPDTALLVESYTSPPLRFTAPFGVATDSRVGHPSRAA